MKKELRIKIIVCAVAVLLAAALLLVYFFVIAPKKANPDDEKMVTLEIIYSDRNFKYEELDATGISTVFELLEKYNEQLDLGLEYETDALFGAYITGLKNTPIDTANGYYYMYTINGGYADGISSQQLKDGDIIVFNYSSASWED